MKIKVPLVTRVGSLECELKFTANLKSDHSWLASLNQRTCLIEVDNDLRGNMRDRAYLHEVVHQIDINYEIGLSEENISRLANGFCEYLNNLGIELDWSDVK